MSPRNTRTCHVRRRRPVPDPQLQVQVPSRHTTSVSLTFWHFVYCSPKVGGMTHHNYAIVDSNVVTGRARCRKTFCTKIFVEKC